MAFLLPLLTAAAPYIGLATGVEGLMNQNNANAQVSQANTTLSQAQQHANDLAVTPTVPWGQQQGAVIQDYANQGINIGRNQGDLNTGATNSNPSPIVQEALRRRQLAITQAQAGVGVSNAEQGLGVAQQNAGYLNQSDPLSLIWNGLTGIGNVNTSPTAGVGAVPDPYATAQATGGFGNF